jgi:hypothetical protein
VKQPNQKIELASGEYDRRKRKGFEPGIAPVARLFKVKEKSLRNYRANHISRLSEGGQKNG